MKKGQMEILGVAVFTVMVITLILISRTTTTSAQEGHNEIRTMIAMLGTTFECNGEQKPVSDFVRMCPENCGCASVAIDSLIPEGRHSFSIGNDSSLWIERNNANCAKKSLLLPSAEGSIEVALGIC
jgi:hypothetical protein